MNNTERSEKDEQAYKITRGVLEYEKESHSGSSSSTYAWLL